MNFVIQTALSVEARRGRLASTNLRVIIIEGPKKSQGSRPGLNCNSIHGPRREPGGVLSAQHRPAVHVQDFTGNKRRPIGGQEDNGAGNLIG